MPNPVAALGALPQISGFAPLPFAAANEFMAMQGGNMALYFGAYYKLGTRLVDSQKNEKFNSMVKNPQELINMLNPHSKAISDNFEKALDNRAEHIQKLILEKAHELELAKVEFNIKLMKELPAEYFQQVINPGDDKTIQEAVGITPKGESTGSLVQDIGNFFKSLTGAVGNATPNPIKIAQSVQNAQSPPVQGPKPQQTYTNPETKEQVPIPKSYTVKIEFESQYRHPALKKGQPNGTYKITRFGTEKGLVAQAKHLEKLITGQTSNWRNGVGKNRIKELYLLRQWIHDKFGYWA